MAIGTQLTDPRLISQTRAVLGEGPVWDDRGERLYWVDIERGELHSCGHDGAGAASVRTGGRICCIVLRSDGPGVAAGLERSIALVEPAPLRVTPLAKFPELPARVRCNDGKCDPAGRFWIGTYNMDNTGATGWLYRYTAGGVPQRTAGPFICTNGPAFSPDGTLLYCVDTYGRRIDRWRLGPDGSLRDRSLVAHFDAPDCGYPDGLTCDAEGCLWVAEWGASRVSRLSPAGERLEVIRLPVSQPTSCTFGGQELRRLYITSAAQGLPAASARETPAGGLFAVDLAVPGLPAARFAG
jgi:sugar lactone lactonase YvrE